MKMTKKTWTLFLPLYTFFYLSTRVTIHDLISAANA